MATIVKDGKTYPLTHRDCVFAQGNIMPTPIQNIHKQEIVKNTEQEKEKK